MAQIITREGKLAISTTEDYPPALVKQMKAAGYKVYTVTEEEVREVWETNTTRRK